MSYFHSPNGVTPLVFSGAKWSRDDEFDSPCSTGGTNHVKITAQYPLPQPPQDPITLLTGNGHSEVIGSGTACVSSDFDEKFVRTGD
jgi:hypothetical protein